MQYSKGWKHFTEHIICGLYAAMNLVFGTGDLFSAISSSELSWHCFSVALETGDDGDDDTCDDSDDEDIPAKCCGEEEIFYQDTMVCGPDKVGDTL